MPGRTTSKKKDNKKNKKSNGSLIVVGSGIQAVRQITLEARQAIENSDKVVYILSDEVTKIWINKLRPDAESLHKYYVETDDRQAEIYSKMIEHIMKYVRQGYSTCLVLYGHPGVFTTGVTKPVIKMAQNKGFATYMQAGISAEDCLFAELDVDPGEGGCQSFEATQFLVHRRRFDSSCHLILWQIGIIGDVGNHPSRSPKRGLTILTDYLKQYYDSKHEVCVYITAAYSIAKPMIQRIPLYKLPEADIDTISTLYVPPNVTRARNIDKKMAQRLGLAEKLGISRKQ